MRQPRVAGTARRSPNAANVASRCCRWPGGAGWQHLPAFHQPQPTAGGGGFLGAMLRLKSRAMAPIYQQVAQQLGNRLPLRQGRYRSAPSAGTAIRHSPSPRWRCSTTAVKSHARPAQCRRLQLQQWLGIGSLGMLRSCRGCSATGLRGGPAEPVHGGLRACHLVRCTASPPLAIRHSRRSDWSLAKIRRVNFQFDSVPNASYCVGLKSDLRPYLRGSGPVDPDRRHICRSETICHPAFAAGVVSNTAPVAVGRCQNPV